MKKLLGLFLFALIAAPLTLMYLKPSNEEETVLYNNIESLSQEDMLSGVMDVEDPADKLDEEVQEDEMNDEILEEHGSDEENTDDSTENMPEIVDGNPDA
jgi:hypothetical protein